ncbi:hypothetical protein ARMGADRAFT_1006829 [Armillaria gallica]|uniref:Uncharacterized protein n=1 Tax=Armillaria gallica TaxID=47427 RepID=A0A2H3EC33_ARMGA|nr:hypothetical protein ARMGADRAFT_1006829 [Armillaria gallica]
MSVLPPELWLEIFSWATMPEGATPYECNYKPFRESPARDERGVDLEVKALTSKLSLVCRDWHAMTTELLYKDVLINRGQNALKSVLCPHQNDPGYGKMVRRAVLPYDSTVTDHWTRDPSPSVEILKLCSRLEVLIRPRTVQYAMRTLTFEFDADPVALPSLKRLEWWHNSEAERSGGINSLAAVLRSSPNISYLFIGGASGMSSIMLDSTPLCLPALETLRLFSVGGFLLHQICNRLTLPALSHVVVDNVLNNGDLEGLWESHGETIESVELGQHLRFMLGDEISLCLEHCPRLEEINYYLFFTAPPHFAGVHQNVHTVSLHAAHNMVMDQFDIWEHLEKHFDLLLGHSLPSLHTVRLFGDWNEIVEQPRFRHLYHALIDRGCYVDL